MRGPNQRVQRAAPRGGDTHSKVAGSERGGLSPARVDVILTDDVRGHLRWVDVGDRDRRGGALHQATRRSDEAAGRDRDAEQLPAYPAGGCGGPYEPFCLWLLLSFYLSTFLGLRL